MCDASLVNSILSSYFYRSAFYLAYVQVIASITWRSNSAAHEYSVCFAVRVNIRATVLNNATVTAGLHTVLVIVRMNLMSRDYILCVTNRST